MELITKILLLLLMAFYCCHGDYVIKRQKTNNTDTIVYNTTSHMKCASNGQVILWKEDRYQCINKTRIQTRIENCTYEENAPISKICKLDGPFSVRNIDDIIWTDRNISCILLKDAGDAGKYIKNNCGLDVPISGILIKMNYKCSNSTFCTVFTLPGKVARFFMTTTKLTANTTLPTSPTQTNSNTTTTIRPVVNQTTSIANRTTYPPPTVTNTTLPPKITNTTTIVVTKQTTGVVTTMTIKTETPLVTMTTVTRTTVAMEEDGWTTKKMVLYIVVPIVSLIVIIICIIFIVCCCCRKRCKYRRRNTLQLLKINSGDTDEDVEGLYAKPLKRPQKRKKKQKKTKDVEISTRPTWKDYDEVGVVIEGTYEKRESLLIDEIPKYGVSAMLLSDENTIPDNKTEEDDPYEPIGRNNSFTPKTFAGQKQAKIEAGRNLTQEGTLFNNAQNEQDDNNLPYLGNSNAPMQMSSFKPGSSMRKKQQRTSVKKPKSDKDNLSETHEDVTITPQPSKKNLAALSSSVEESGNLLSPQTASTDGSYERIPSDIEPDEKPKQNGISNNAASTAPAKYADIDFTTDSNGEAVQHKTPSDEVGNYTDVIITDD